MRFALLVVLASLCSQASAQVTYSTSPSGLLAKEGASSFAMVNKTSYQALDRTHVTGKPKALKAIAFRRDSTNVARSSGGSTRVVVKVGVGKPLGYVVGDQAKNFAAPPKTMINGYVRFPTWTSRPSTPPAAFDFVLPFRSSYVYSGTKPLAWQFSWNFYSDPNGRSEAQHFDRAMRPNVVVDKGVAVGKGCLSFKTATEFLTAGPSAKSVGMQINAAATGGSLGSPVLWSVDLKDSNLQIANWCARLHAYPTVLIPLGTANAFGWTQARAFAVPYDRALEGLPVYSQMFSTRSTGPILSEARKNALPKAGSSTGSFEVAEVWVYDQRPARITHGGSIVARWRH